MKGEINSNTIIVGDFNTSLTSLDRSDKQQISKETQTLDDTMDQLDLIEISISISIYIYIYIYIYITFHAKKWKSLFFQVHMEHSPG